MGYSKAPLLELSKAVALIPGLDPQEVAAAVFSALDLAEDILDDDEWDNPFKLTQDEIAAINLYTQQLVYLLLNSVLRERDRTKVTPFFPFLRLLMSGMDKLPSHEGILYRGVKLKLEAKCYQTKKKFIWWSFSSCTTSGEALQNPMFLGAQGERTLFAIDCTEGKDIQRFSSYKNEAEILLPPGLQFRVGNRMLVPGAVGLTLINVKQLPVPKLFF
jgi:hypothetical protein